ncbi:MAG: retropepsin-like aspartic protease [bacterium]
MKKKIYQLEKIGNLLVCKAALMGNNGVRIAKYLIDTGSTYTIIPVEVLTSTGYELTTIKEHVRLITGSGYIIAPYLKVTGVQVLGNLLNDFKVVAHTLPPNRIARGVIGMDLLTRINGVIWTKKGLVEVEIKR